MIDVKKASKQIQNRNKTKRKKSKPTKPNTPKVSKQEHYSRILSVMNFACTGYVRRIKNSKVLQNIPKFLVILAVAPTWLASYSLNMFNKIVHERSIESIRLLG